MRKNHNLHLLVQQLQRRKSKTIMSNDNGRTCGHENRIVRKKRFLKLILKKKENSEDEKHQNLKIQIKWTKKSYLMFWKKSRTEISTFNETES